MKRKLIKIIICLLVILLILPGCNNKSSDKIDSNTTDVGEVKSTIHIGAIMKTMSNPYYISIEEGMQAVSDKYGYKLSVQAPELESDTETQLKLMENYITQEVDCIILTTNGSTELVPGVKKANDANIPVIIIDSRLYEDALEKADAHIECFIGSDNYFGGSLAAESMSELLNGEGKIAVIEGVAGQEVSVERVGGFVDKAKELGLDVVSSQPADWDQGKGYTVAQNIIQANPDINGLFAASDLMALGAVKALEDAGIAEQVTVIGFDANDDAKQAIRDNRMDGSIAQDPVEMGKRSVEAFKTLLEGGEVDAEIPIDVQLVDKSFLEKEN